WEFQRSGSSISRPGNVAICLRRLIVQHGLKPNIFASLAVSSLATPT
ncbi:hypothetical protein, partial [Methylomonas albis]